MRSFAAVEFLCGALMFSYWLGKVARKDLRQVGDGNPGAFNLWQSAGYQWGLAGILLDFMKGYVPLVFWLESGMLGRDYGMTLLAVFSFYKKGKYASREADGFQVVVGMAMLSIFLLVAGYALPCSGGWLVNLIVIGFTNRQAIRSFLTGKGGKLPRFGDGVTL